MKSLHVSLCLLLFCNLLCFADTHEAWEKKEREKWFVERRNWVESARSKNDLESILKLGSIVRGVGSRWDIASPAARNLHGEALEILITTPGHAEYFAAEVERLREAELEREHGRQRTTYDFWRAIYLRDTLQHIPSPETVKVLGRYLHDVRDTPPSETGDAPSLPSNAYLACAALANMGLRVDPPLPDSGIMRWRHDVDEIRAWYAKVASGEIPFSFKGQAVEYRFNPDGTWKTIPIANPPDDAPDDSAAVPNPVLAPEEKRPSKTPPAMKPDARQNPWPWIGAGVAVIALVIGFMKLRR